METGKIGNLKVHHGRNIRRVRMEKNIKQEVLSEKVNMSQPTVSRYENMKVIDEETLQRFAKALNVPVDYLETLEEDAPTVVFENNTINNSDQGGANTQVGFELKENNNTASTHFNPIEKIAELYERLLKEKDDKIATFEKRLDEMEKRLSESK